MAIKEVFELLFTTVVSLSGELLEQIGDLFDAKGSIQNTILAATLGISAAAAGALITIWGVFKFIVHRDKR